MTRQTGHAKMISSAGMVELVDSVDLGSSVLDVQVRVLLPAPNQKEDQGPPFVLLRIFPVPGNHFEEYYDH